MRQIKGVISQDFQVFPPRVKAVILRIADLTGRSRKRLTFTIYNWEVPKVDQLLQITILLVMSALGGAFFYERLRVPGLMVVIALDLLATDVMASLWSIKLTASPIIVLVAATLVAVSFFLVSTKIQRRAG